VSKDKSIMGCVAAACPQQRDKREDDDITLSLDRTSNLSVSDTGTTKQLVSYRKVIPIDKGARSSSGPVTSGDVACACNEMVGCGWRL